MEIIQTTALLRSAIILKRLEETCCHSNSSEKPSANAGVKNSQRSLNNNNNKFAKLSTLLSRADHRINLKECEKKDKYLDLVRELKKLWNMKVTIVPIVIGALGTITKGLLKCLEDLKVRGWVETIQMTALLRTARTLRRVLETWGDLLSLKLQWKTIS